MRIKLLFIVLLLILYEECTKAAPNQYSNNPKDHSMKDFKQIYSNADYEDYAEYGDYGYNSFNGDNYQYNVKDAYGSGIEKFPSYVSGENPSQNFSNTNQKFPSYDDLTPSYQMLPNKPLYTTPPNRIRNTIVNQQYTIKPIMTNPIKHERILPPSTTISSTTTTTTSSVYSTNKLSYFLFQNEYANRKKEEADDDDDEYQNVKDEDNSISSLDITTSSSITPTTSNPTYPANKMMDENDLLRHQIPTKDEFFSFKFLIPFLKKPTIIALLCVGALMIIGVIVLLVLFVTKKLKKNNNSKEKKTSNFAKNKFYDHSNNDNEMEDSNDDKHLMNRNDLKNYSQKYAIYGAYNGVNNGGANAPLLNHNNSNNNHHHNPDGSRNIFI
ncbi:hypothetical protein SNEBB_000388 [Seison nebaliae]|nr:hypothetical protein SNEBB_000388 [Seison nebaliae]